MKTHVKNVAIKMIKADGLINLSRSELCRKSGIPDGSFTHVMNCTFTEFVQDIKKQIVSDNKIHKVSKTRTEPTLRKEYILNVALTLSEIKGYTHITRDDLAEKAGVSTGLITRYFETMNQLRRDIMRAAVKRNIPVIVAQGLVLKDRHALKASKELKTKASHIIANF